MTRKETTVVALKCYAIYIVIQLVVFLPTLAGICLKLGHFDQRGTSTFFIGVVSFLSVVCYLVAALFLWKTANSLLIGEAMQETGSSEIGMDEVMKMVLACMGVYFVTAGVIVFPRIFVEFKIAESNSDPQALVSAVSLASVVLQIIFGGLLIAKPAKWVKMIQSIRGS